MMKTRIGLVRHGETLWNKIGRWQGNAPVPLNDEGRFQSTLLAEYLTRHQETEPITAIYSSDLLRCRQTAETLAEHLGLPLRLERRLREIDLGDWQGLTMDEIHAWDGENLRAVQADPFHTPRPGGECFAQVAERAAAALWELAEKHRGEYILLVSHGGTIRALLHRIGVLHESQVLVGNTSLTRLSRDPATDQWSLDALSLMEHLGQRPVLVGGNEG